MDFLDKIVWTNPIKTYLLAAGLAIGGLGLAWLVAKLLRRYVISGAAETEGRWDDLVADVGVRPIAIIIVLASLHTAVGVLAMPEWLRRTLWSAFVVLWTVVGAMFAVRVLNGLLEHYVKRYVQQTEESLYIQLTQTVRSALKIVIWLVATIFVVSNLGFNVSSILAGLGLGGLALALAAKDTLSNIFGSFTILVNGPFRVGDAVTYHGHTGKIEEVGLRDTRIRTWDGHLVVVPNALAPTSVVENISSRPSFRVLFKLGLVYQTTQAQLDRAADIIRSAVTAEPGTSDDIRVHFLEFGESAIDVQVIYFIEDTDRLLDIRHAVNQRIKAEFDAAGIGFAYRTLMVHQPGQA